MAQCKTAVSPRNYSFALSQRCDTFVCQPCGCRYEVLEVRHISIVIKIQTSILYKTDTTIYVMQLRDIDMETLSRHQLCKSHSTSTYTKHSFVFQTLYSKTCYQCITLVLVLADSQQTSPTGPSLPLVGWRKPSCLYYSGIMVTAWVLNNWCFLHSPNT